MKRFAFLLSLAAATGNGCASSNAPPKVYPSPTESAPDVTDGDGMWLCQPTHLARYNRFSGYRRSKAVIPEMLTFVISSTAFNDRILYATQLPGDKKKACISIKKPSQNQNLYLMMCNIPRTIYNTLFFDKEKLQYLLTITTKRQLLWREPFDGSVAIPATKYFEFGTCAAL